MATKQNLADQNLDHANLVGSDLSDADLSGASLRHARLTGANLTGANLDGSDLHGAHLQHSDVTDAYLRNADLTAAQLQGVDLQRAASIEGARLTGAKGVDPVPGAPAGEAAAPMQLGRWLDQLAALNGEIVGAVRGGFALPETDPARADRRAEVEVLVALRRRRDLIEERILEEIEASMPLHAGSTIDDR